MSSEDGKLLLKVDNFNKLLEDQNLTVYGLSKIMNVTPSTIYRLINGDLKGGATSNTVGKMLKAFGLTEDDFPQLFIFESSLPKGNEEKQPS
ncbi:helix-turn-helix domain-containing protein [Lentilactobacillus senioris]|uniref:helix-turn-helix domain-containing protein n=1 Tax=Lentilactobacillus senioris TaxID=931534 RepID=UPI003D2D0EF4